jgi:hypothetical protein
VGAAIPIVIDTNVLAIAEGLHAGASETCIAACTNVVLQIERGSPLLVDDADEIFAEYLGTLCSSGYSGLVSKLIVKLYRERRGSPRSVPVSITPSAAAPKAYDEVPDDLADFDRDDQKFIAVAATTGGYSPIVAGLDREWWDRLADFASSGLLVQFPCMTDLL